MRQPTGKNFHLQLRVEKMHRFRFSLRNILDDEVAVDDANSKTEMQSKITEMQIILIQF